jgi:hypothetical protein
MVLGVDQLDQRLVLAGRQPDDVDYIVITRVRFALDEVRRPDLGDNPKSKDSPTI